MRLTLLLVRVHSLMETDNAVRHEEILNELETTYWKKRRKTALDTWPTAQDFGQ